METSKLKSELDNLVKSKNNEKSRKSINEIMKFSESLISEEIMSYNLIDLFNMKANLSNRIDLYIDLDKFMASIITAGIGLNFGIILNRKDDSSMVIYLSVSLFTILYLSYLSYKKNIKNEKVLYYIVNFAIEKKKIELDQDKADSVKKESRVKKLNNKNRKSKLAKIVNKS